MKEKEKKDSWFEIFHKSLTDTIKNSSPVFKTIDAVDTVNRSISENVKNNIRKKEIDVPVPTTTSLKTFVKDMASKAIVKSGDVVEQGQRIVAGAGADVAQESLQLINLIGDKTNIYELDPELHENQQKFLEAYLKGLVGEESLETVKRGGKDIIKIKEPNSMVGELSRDMLKIFGSITVGTKGIGAGATAITTNTAKGKVLAEAVSKSSLASKSVKTAKLLTGAAVGEQVSINPYEDRLANFLGEVIGDDEGALNDLLTFLEADESKTEAEARMGLLYEGVALYAGLPAVWFGSKALYNTVQNKEAFVAAMKDLTTGMQKGAVNTDMFKNVLKTASKDSRLAPHLDKVKDEDVSKLWQFGNGKTKNALAWLGLGERKAGEVVRSISTAGSKYIGTGFQEVFKSRGYFTPEVFKIFGKRQAAKNAWIDRTEIVAERMEKTLNNLAENTTKYKNQAKVEAKINQALKDDKFKGLTRLSKAELSELSKDVWSRIPGLTDEGRETLRASDAAKLQAQKEFNKLVPPELRDDVLQMRGLIDDFSELTLQIPNSQISKELKETITNNLGKWLHTSYEVFESPGLARKRFKAVKKYTDEKGLDTRKKGMSASEKTLYGKTFDTAFKYFYDIEKGLKKNVGVQDFNIRDDALKKMRTVLEKADQSNAGDYFGRMADFHGSNLSMFKRKGDLDEPLRDLLGEIKSPSVNVLKSVSHLASYVEDNRFLTEAYDILKGRRVKTVRGKLEEPDSYYNRNRLPATSREINKFLDTNGVRRSGHIFSKDTGGIIDSKTGIEYMTQLTGKQFGPLDGKYMTREMAMMFGQRQGLVNQLQNVANSNVYKNFLALKGYGQASKTVFNHITHLRNTLGGMFFSLANGNNPFHSSFAEAKKTLYQRRFADVPEEESIKYYNKLVSYDLVNTGARYGDIQTLLKDAADTSVDRFVAEHLTTLGNQTKILKKYGKNIQDLYIAEDDLFKIINYEQELNSILKAAKVQKYKLPNRRGSFSYDEYLEEFPAYAQTLEREAAEIVRQTVPTYSLVPNAIKQLRKMPIGNYFSFPAEMVRTSHNIFKQGVNELFLSNNSVTRMRGARRIGGFFAAGMYGAEGLSNMTKMWHGVSDEEEEHIRNLDPYDYSKNSKLAFYRDKTGKLYKNDFSFIDPYDTIKRPFQTALNQIAHGKRTKEDIDKVLLDASLEAMTEFTSPFISNSLFYEGISTVMDDGVNSEGFKIKGWDTSDTGEKLVLAFNEIAVKPFMFGFMREIPKTAKAFMGDKYETTAEGRMAKALEAITSGNVGKKEYTKTGQVLANLTGFRFEPVDIKRSLELKAAQYLRDFDDARAQLERGLGSKQTGKSFLNALSRANKKAYYAQKDFQVAFESAYELGMTIGERDQILENARIPANIKTAMGYNTFLPILPTETKYERYLEENITGSMGLQDLKYYINEYKKIYGSLPMLDIGFSREVDEDFPVLRTVPKENLEFARSPKSTKKIIKDITEREGKSKGGFIEGPDVVSDTKEDPADRVNPYTGEPYQEQMGRLGFNKGTIVDPRYEGAKALLRQTHKYAVDNEAYGDDGSGDKVSFHSGVIGKGPKEHYIVNGYNPETNRFETEDEIFKRVAPLIKSGQLKPYEDHKIADAERAKMRNEILQETGDK